LTQEFQVLVHHARVAYVVQRADVRMSERGDDPGLLLEARALACVSSDLRTQRLDRDRALEAGVSCFENLTHVTGAERRDDLVGAETCAWWKEHARFVPC
jgi:hypothetical protein